MQEDEVACPPWKEPQTKILVGGCQCGAVRYRAEGQPRKIHYCHCRMCQRAVGNMFAAFVPMRQDQGDLGTAEPVPIFLCRSAASARLRHAAELCLRQVGLDLPLPGSLDEPTAVRPEFHYGENQMPWLHFLPTNSRVARTNEAELSWLVSYQYNP